MTDWGTNPPPATTQIHRMQSKARNQVGHRNYANDGCRDASSFDERAVALLPALFTRSCCFHHALSTTSSATRATKSL